MIWLQFLAIVVPFYVTIFLLFFNFAQNDTKRISLQSGFKERKLAQLIKVALRLIPKLGYIGGQYLRLNLYLLAIYLYVFLETARLPYQLYFATIRVQVVCKCKKAFCQKKQPRHSRKYPIEHNFNYYLICLNKKHRLLVLQYWQDCAYPRDTDFALQILYKY